MNRRNYLDDARERFLSGIGVPAKKPFVADDFQNEAISLIANGKDVLVVAPTGSGKTFIALEAIRTMLEQNLRSVYTTPLKALSNTKFNELKKIFEPKYKVGLLTGDRKIEGDAGVVIATTEIYRNELYQTNERYSLVVLDEVHFIADPQRGAVWEESIILTPPSTTLLMLSASISNAEEISAWVAEVRGKECRIVQKKERPVELRYGFLHPDIGVIPLTDQNGLVLREINDFYGSFGLDSSGMRLKGKGLRGQPWRKKSAQVNLMGGMFREFPATKIMYELAQDDLLPAILFRTSRRQCDADIEALEGARGGRQKPEQQAAIIKEIESVIAKYGMEREIITGHPHYPALVTIGAGAHHAGQLLLWRLMLEELMSRSALRLMIATGTVAAGVDFPARTVIITAHSKRGSEGFGVLKASEFQQMAGRAGRRGKDSVGICLIAPGIFSDARVFADISIRPPEPLRSSYFAAPSSVLNLLKFRNADELRFVVSKSLAAFLDRKAGKVLRESAAQEEAQLAADSSITGERRKKAEKRVRRKFREAELTEGKQMELLEQSLQGLERLGYIAKGALTEKGSWAANLCTSLVIELAEAVESGLLDDLSVEELTAIVASIAGDPHRAYFSLKENPIKPEYFEKMREILLRVRMSFLNPQNSEIGVVPNAALTALTWIEARDWVDFAGLLRLNGVAEGDCARLITQTADHLNQISRLHETHPTLAAAAAEGRKRILRPPLSEALPEI